MWVAVYSEGAYLVEKRLEEEGESQEAAAGKKYASVLERLVDSELGRYRVSDRDTLAVLGVSGSFSDILGWIANGMPKLPETICQLLDVGAYVKSQVSRDSVVILGTAGLGVLTMTERLEMRYAEIRRVVQQKHRLVVGDAQGRAAEFEAFAMAQNELGTLILSGVAGEHLERQLVLRCISERIWNLAPVYGQQIQSVLVGEAETISFTEDFMVVREGGEYLFIPLDMLRKVEITKGWTTKLWIKDANQRVFEYLLFVGSDQELAEELVARIGREEKQFKEAYISVLLDMIERGAEDIEPEKAAKESKKNKNLLNLSSEYKMYLWAAEKDQGVLAVAPKERPYLWMECFCLCGMATAAGGYEASLAVAAKTKVPAWEQIEKDVGRASYEPYPEAEAASLGKVLSAFSVSNNGEYLQSHSLIGRALFRVLGEHGAFLGLHHIFNRILPRYTGPEVYGLKRDVQVLLVLVQEHFPGLYENLSGKEIELEMLVAPWIAGLFTTVFAQGHLNRVFDHLARYGAAFVFKLALALLERMYPQLSRSQQSSSILKAAKEYLFHDTAVPAIDEKEFAVLLARAMANTAVNPDRIHAERQQYEIANRPPAK